MVLHLNLTSACHVIIIRAYASMKTFSDNVKENVYEDFDKAIKVAHQYDKLNILSDFNTRVVRNHKA